MTSTTCYGFKTDNRAVLVGIISQPFSEVLRAKSYKFDELWSYIPGSYIDWVAQTGVYPVVIPYDADHKLLDYMIEKMDMFIFPGGGANIKSRENEKIVSEFQTQMSYITQKIIMENAKKRYLPLIATCLGFENLVISEAK